MTGPFVVRRPSRRSISFTQPETSAVGAPAPAALLFGGTRMPRSIAEVNAVRQADDNSAVTGSPEHSSGRHGYDPNQPRVPAGHSYGRRWTQTRAPPPPTPPQA